jgi:ornithine cyclodeaminase/alanine dehydrogenase-like protein (mu-crystallin family)
MLKENYLSEKTSAPNSPNCTRAIAARQFDRERIFIRAIGLVNQDIAMANHIYRCALESGIGTRLPY